MQRLGVMEMQACQHRDVFKDGREFLRNSVDLHRLTNQTRKIERVEMEYFLKQSKSRL